jgi:ribosomal protein S3
LFKKYRIKRFYFYLIKFLYSFVFKKFLYFVEKRFWNFLKVFLIFNLSKIVPLSSKIFINFHFWRRVRLDASFVSRYLQIRLFQGVPFRSLYYKILQTLSIFLYQKCILGFKISFKGRFSRRQRASFMWERVSSTPLNDKSSFVDFSYDFIILKYGACGLKVWLHLSDNYLLGVKSFHTVF